MTMTKGKAFVLCIIGIMAVFFFISIAVVIRDKEYSLIPVGLCLTALCSITGGYIGFQVANNGIKGHFFNEEMWEKENPKKGEEGEK